MHLLQWIKSQSIEDLSPLSSANTPWGSINTLMHKPWCHISVSQHRPGHRRNGVKTKTLLEHARWGLPNTPAKQGVRLENGRIRLENDNRLETTGKKVAIMKKISSQLNQGGKRQYKPLILKFSSSKAFRGPLRIKKCPQKKTYFPDSWWNGPRRTEMEHTSFSFSHSR